MQNNMRNTNVNLVSVKKILKVTSALKIDIK